MAKESVTMTDVARLAKVARSTVSHVLNGTDRAIRISAPTRQRVLEAAGNLGYRLNIGGRTIRGKSLKCIGVLGFESDWDRPNESTLVVGINRAAIEGDYYLAYVSIDKEKIKDNEYVPRMLTENLVDGLVVLQSAILPEHLHQKIEKYNIPAIWAQYKRDTDAIWLDESSYGYEATRRLIELGHKRICYIDFSFDHKFWALERLDGYREAMAESGLQTDEVLLHDNRRNYASLVKQILDRPVPPTAYMTHSLSSALPLIQVAARKGLFVPDDISVVTVAESFNALLAVPHMTHWKCPLGDIGYIAAKMLIEKFKDPAKPIPSRTIKLEVVEGGSIGPCP